MVLEMLEVEETIIETHHKCPKCGGRVERRIRKEKQEKEQGQWYVGTCESCDFWECGFT